VTNLATIDHEAATSLAPAVPGVLTPMDMLNKAVESGANMEVVTKLMDLQERWEKNQARKAFDEAMASAKADIQPISQNRKVEFEAKNGGASTNYKFEDLAQIERQVGPILTKFGLSYRYRVESEIDQPVRVTCVVAHRDGHSEETTLSAGRDSTGNKNSIQSIGSTITYLQRYTLKAALGLAVSHDDDGKSAQALDTVSPEQVEMLFRLIEASGTPTEKFCEWAKIEAVQHLLANQFDAAVRALEAKKAKRQ
jgi:hypothetical protein